MLFLLWEIVWNNKYQNITNKILIRFNEEKKLHMKKKLQFTKTMSKETNGLFLLILSF